MVIVSGRGLAQFDGKHGWNAYKGPRFDVDARQLVYLGG